MIHGYIFTYLDGWMFQCISCILLMVTRMHPKMIPQEDLLNEDHDLVIASVRT